ncbi:5-oxoprolinase subunit PxpB [Aliidiomarina haloalkalitolerans]|uniref:Allophanate hydrolase subunit 1 n=1 Tax=Aliidiomarina haloalkalitolerans TaxID=859059 RepID=A0A432VZ09_9GAMM|nr:5-oxoprolinase subunit PxpB [Aliidiomarina haloalkalitolerans]MCL4410091.1 5-oxoprolinase subunit PxpB [Gammaproteobacteria bacterium]RUO21897.1 allophanate hydrolase subunit 1 [Aliidiomarina haloalkalitolerans]
MTNLVTTAQETELAAPVAEFCNAGVDALLVKFGDEIDACMPSYLASIRERVLNQLADVVNEVVPAYASLLVYYEPRNVRVYDLQLALQGIIDEVPWLCSPWSAEDANAPGKLVTVPVCYDPTMAPDLERVLQHTGLTAEELIAAHSGQQLQVYALGFAPGFAYLGSLPDALKVPRLDAPRTHVPAGSVGIAERQSAVYPQDSPGGWNIIGRSPVQWFDPKRTPMTAVQVGDRIQFKAITLSEYQAYAEQGAQ